MKIKNKVDVNRRRAVMGGAAGVGLAAWHKPMIESVLLPAHAQTSVAGVFFLADIDAGPLVVQNNPILDFFIPQAYAGKGEGPRSTVTITIRAEDTSGDLSRFDVGIFTRATGIKGFEVVETVHRGEVSVASGGTLVPTETPCDVLEVEDIDVEVVTVDGALFSLRLLGLDLVVDAPAEDLPLPTAVCTPVQFGDFAYTEPPSMDKSSLLDLIVPSAMAGVNGENGQAVLTTDSVIAINSGDNANFTVSYQNGVNRWTGSLDVDDVNPGQLSLVQPGCGMPPPTINARIVGVNPFEMELNVDSPSNPMASFTLQQEDDPSLEDLGPCMLVPA